jgi:hypothetical protein
MVDRCRRTGEKEPVLGSQFLDQANDISVRGEPVVVESIQGPFPPRVVETGGQTAGVGPRFVDGDGVPSPCQIVSRAEACDSCANDTDVHVRLQIE